ncbi:ATP-dependent endonuclease [Chryseobacterium sp. Alg-005]|uniref:ATP-dependent nuclease n=1 Tax=Chryseobacterium sp. Alg-005 TaxID=3159516 RepID=UPI0035557676
MRISCFKIQNFRRLKDIIIDLETDISIFVGANNSGKTSATHAFDLFVNDKKDKFTVYDFTSSCWEEINKIGDDPEKSIADELELPSISLDIWFEIGENDLHRVLDLLPAVTWEGSIIGLRIQFQPKSSKDILARYIDAKTKASAHKPKAEEKTYRPWPKNLVDFLGKNLNQEYQFKFYSLDRSQFDNNFNQNLTYVPSAFPSDRGKPLLKSLIRVDTLHAQRYLSDQASNGRAEDLSKCLSRFYKRNLEKREEDHEALSALFDSELQFNEHLKKVFEGTLSKLNELGYPGILNPHLVIRSALNPTMIMSQDTRVHYSLDGKDNSLTLPDNYNGLGYKNLIYMVVELLDIQARWVDEKEERALLQLIVIEEPEAHLHAQLQQVFIRQLLEILKINGDDAEYYSTQLILTTHSPHILYERGFRPIRYFRRQGEAGVNQYSTALNLSNFYLSEPQKDFLERYMKLTHCDLFFADATILVEGTVERILLPLMIEKCASSLKTSYLSIMEVGGAYAYRFKSLIEFLGIPALVITDLDSVKQYKNEEGEDEEEDDEQELEIELEMDKEDGSEPEVKKYRLGKACVTYYLDAITSNQTLVNWLPRKILISDLLAVKSTDLVQPCTDESQATIYVTYQRNVDVEWNGNTEAVAGRTLEEAFALENANWSQDMKRKHIGLKLTKSPQTVLEFAEKIHKRVKSNSFDKTSFALGVMAEDPVLWKVPLYIEEGLQWLTGLIVQDDSNNEIATSIIERTEVEPKL